MSSSQPDLSKLSIARKSLEISSPKIFQRGLLVFLPIIIICLVSFFFMTSGAEKALEKEVEKTAQAAPSPLLSNQVSQQLLRASGYVVASTQASVSSKATGRLRELRVEEGDQLKMGEVIGILENEDVVALVREQEAALNALQAQVRAAQAEFDDAKLHFERMVRLEKEHVVTAAEKDQAIARYKRANADVQSAVANAELGQARVEKAKVELSYTYIVAPFDGTVLTKNADIGEIVAPFGSSSDARATLVTMADMSSLEVEADVSESYLAKVHVGQATQITLDSFPEAKYDGVVSKIVPTVDRAKATVQVKVKFVNLDSRVLPEMSAKVSFQLMDKSKDAATAPSLNQ